MEIHQLIVLCTSKDIFSFFYSSNYSLVLSLGYKFVFDFSGKNPMCVQVCVCFYVYVGAYVCMGVCV